MLCKILLISHLLERHSSFDVGLKPEVEGWVHSFLSFFKLTYMDSSNMWYGGGHPFRHSRFAVVKSTVRSSHFDANASQIMKIINITAISEMNEPTDKILFHTAYATE